MGFLLISVLGTDLIYRVNLCLHMVVASAVCDVTVRTIYNIIVVKYMEVTYIVHIKGCTQTEHLGQPNVSCLARCPYFTVC